MATPRKGAAIREFAANVIDRITGRAPAAPSSSGASTALTSGASDVDQAHQVPHASADAKAQAWNPAKQYFGAGAPLTPMAPEGTTVGRRFDYPYAINQTYQPRTEQGQNSIGFRALRRMATPAEGGLDLLRLAIETRKDQMVAQRWSLRGKKKNDDGGQRARDLEQLLMRPDGVHTFHTWMRLLLEDHFVIDAPTVYYSTVGGRPLWEQMDGATIKLLITADDGRTPRPPLPAYQQIIKGMVADEYTTQEMGYYVYNPMPWRLYGMSRVEQVVVTVKMALERACSQMSYYTEGTTPDGFMEVPKDWTLDQIQQYTEWFNADLEGQSGARRKTRFVPQDAKYVATKDVILKDAFDEWLARIICYCFSLSPQALVKEMNRATSETAKQSSQEEGLEPTKLWFKSMLDDALERSGFADLELAWEDEEIVDPSVKATVIATYRTAKIMTVDEARQMAGLAPLTPKQRAELEKESAPPPGLAGTLAGAGETDVQPPKKPIDEKDDTEKTASAKAGRTSGGRSLPPLKRNTKRSDRIRARIHALAAEVLDRQRVAAETAIGASSEKFTKFIADDVPGLIKEIQAEGWTDDERAKLWKLLSDLSAERAEAALEQVKPYVDSDEYAAALTQANERAVEWARFRSTNMITEVDDTTQQLVNELTASAIEDGLTNQELSDLLSGSFGFSEDRADMIARTETAFAETAGTLEGYAASGVVAGKGWSADDGACDECAAMDGEEVGLDETFSDGSDGAPAHPNCECSNYAVLSEEAAALIVEE